VLRWPGGSVLWDAEPVRKQYHLVPTARGFDAWDVDRLIELSRDLPVELIEVASLAEIDGDYWFVGSGVPVTVRVIVEHMRLIEEVDLSYPIILGHDGRVMDGMHRVARALLEGQDQIKAVRLAHQVDPDYRGCQPDDLPYDD
jgi:hypothetical protein